MGNYTTFKNSLKKIESKQQTTEKLPGCGVISFDDFAALPDGCFQNAENGKVGYLLVPRKLSLEEWAEKVAKNSQ